MRQPIGHRRFACITAFVLLITVSACENETAESERPAGQEAKEIVSTQKNAPAEKAPATQAGKTAQALKQNVKKTWTGDLSGMAERRMIRVLLPYSKTFFFLDKGQKKGINYEFLTRFEKHLNKTKKERKGEKPSRLKVVMIPTPRDKLLQRLIDGQGDLVVGNLTVTERRLAMVDFSDPWLTGVNEYVVTHGSAPELTSVEDLSGKTVHVRKTSSYWESLKALNERLKEEGKKPVNIVLENELLEDEDLLEMVNADALPAVVVDSHKAQFWSRVLGDIKIHEKVPVRSGGEIAWAYRKNSPELAKAVNEFIGSIKVGSTKLGSVIFSAYLKQQKWLERLNKEKDRKKFLELVALFQKYGKEYDINWLILAAKAYQESRFDHSVKGPRGAVGIMQIKPATAKGSDVNIPDITGLENNINAGTKYVRFLMDKYYADLKPDPFNQTLMAFAGYNAGPNRIANLRKKAKERGLNDTKWFNNVEWVVAESVGPVTVNYVRNIFQYFLIYSGVYKRHLAIQEVKTR